jgi:hypothetical protein
MIPISLTEGRAVQLRTNRVKERSAVNAARTLFEASGCVFQEVDQGNDYGKDAYVDLVEGKEVTGFCIALQIKGGVSYRRPFGYAIPVDGHRGVWKQSPLPVAGIVHDPENNALYWCDISSAVAQDGDATEILVRRDNLLSTATLESDFKPHFRRLAKERGVGQAILHLASEASEQRISAILDCFGSGRSDPATFVILRYMLARMQGEDFKVATWILSHTTLHPDIFWHKGNTVPGEVEAAVKPHYRWSHDEIFRFLKEVPLPEWERGRLGQCVYYLLIADPDIKEKMRRVAISAGRAGEEEVAWAGLYMYLCWSGRRAKERYQDLITEEPAFRELELIPDLEDLLGTYERLSFW